MTRHWAGHAGGLGALLVLGVSCGSGPGWLTDPVKRVPAAEESQPSSAEGVAGASALPAPAPMPEPVDPQLSAGELNTYREALKDRLRRDFVGLQPSGPAIARAPGEHSRFQNAMIQVRDEHGRISTACVNNTIDLERVLAPKGPP